jgi:hypothetical protein
MAAAAKLPPKNYVVQQRVLVRRPEMKMPLEAVVLEPRGADGLWAVEGAAPLGKCRVPDAQLAPGVRRDEEVVYQRKDGSDVLAVIINVDVSIWPPSYAIKEKATEAVADTNPNRIWPPAARKVLLAENAMDELLAEEEAAAAAAAGGGGGGKGKKGKGKGK